MARMMGLTPFLRVPDIDMAISFFVDTLGFRLDFKGGEYAYVSRDNVAFRMIEDCDYTPHGQGAYRTYINVDDVDELYAELKSRLDLLPEGQSCAPFDQDYRMRELTVIGPDGEFIAFGQEIPAKG